VLLVVLADPLSLRAATDSCLFTVGGAVLAVFSVAAILAAFARWTVCANLTALIVAVSPFISWVLFLPLSRVLFDSSASSSILAAGGVCAACAVAFSLFAVLITFSRTLTFDPSRPAPFFARTVIGTDPAAQLIAGVAAALSTFLPVATSASAGSASYYYYHAPAALALVANLLPAADAISLAYIRPSAALVSASFAALTTCPIIYFYVDTVFALTQPVLLTSSATAVLVLLAATAVGLALRRTHKNV
jgi:hypothetical protein